jgi:GNAT superfamily N-acetyltransferase
VGIRPALPADVEECGRIIHLAFKGIAEQHGFPPSFPTVSDGIHVARQRIASPTVYGLVAEINGRVVGSTFMNERDPIYSVGPVSVDPGIQEQGVGRRMMEAVVERGRNAAGIRLTQDAFNTASMPLYASLGFDVAEPLVLIEGTPRGAPAAEVIVRRMKREDIGSCGELCLRVHGFPRTCELAESIDSLSPFVAVRDGRITGYASAASRRGHGVAESDEDMEALLLGATAAGNEPLSFLLPVRQGELFRWCLREGMRVIEPKTLMARGAYHKPRGSFFPSTQY